MDLVELNGYIYIPPQSQNKIINTIANKSKSKSIKTVNNTNHKSIEMEILSNYILARCIIDNINEISKNKLKTISMDMEDAINGITFGYNSNNKYRIYNRYLKYIPEFHNMDNNLFPPN